MPEPELFSHRESVRFEPSPHSPGDGQRIPQPIFSDQTVDPAAQGTQERAPR